MSTVIRTLQVPYGAFELKATYQRNMMFANLVVILAVFTIVATFWVPGDVPARPPVDKERLLRPLPPIPIRGRIRPVPAQPQVGIRPPSNVRSDAGTFVPVPDELAPVDQLVEIEYVSSDPIGGNTDGGPQVWGGTSDGVPDYDYIPARGEFRIVEKLPLVIELKQPIYPRLAKQAGIEGVVLLSVLVLNDGTVGRAVTEKSSGTVALDEAAVRAAYDNIFSPAIQSGRPVTCWVSYKVEFVIE